MMRRYASAVALVGLATGVGLLVRAELAAPDHVMLYLLAIGVTAAVFGRGPAVVASVLSVAGYDFLFVPPYGTLAVADQRYLLTFAMMFGVGIVTSAVTARLRRELERARAGEDRMGALYELSRELGAAPDDDGIAATVAEQAAKAFGARASVLLPKPDGTLAVRAVSPGAPPLGEHEMNAARWAFRHGRAAGLGTRTEPSAAALCVPIRSGLLEGLGVLALAPPDGAPLDPDRRYLAEVFARQTALGLERARLAEDARSAALRARAEEIKSSLLSAVSHDLRTPLGTITGAASSLREGGPRLSPDARAELLETLCDEATRLERLVTNLLEMTRLDSGAVSPRREWVPLEEIVGTVMHRLEPELEGREVTVDVPESLPLVSVDPVLLEQVLLNLLENARKHTPPGTPLELGARHANGTLVVEVRDRGPGIPTGSEGRVFEKFFRGGSSAPGAGLGLAICRGIVAVHGGSIGVENRSGGGAVFRVVLPQDGEPPGVDRESEDTELRVVP
jgi:two-component system, OmpR family, sensor histidine kinase KdpD